MSWDISLHVPGVDWAGCSWNYTHNINGMVEAALAAACIPLQLHPDSSWVGWCERHSAEIGPSWWMCMDAQPGPDGLAMIVAVIEEFETDPDVYRAMDPPNGWGSMDSLLAVLREMRDAATTEAPLVWAASG